MEIAACPRCASRDLAPATVADGLWPGGAETLLWVCRACAYRGAPLLFSSAADHEAFRRGLAGEAGERIEAGEGSEAGEADGAPGRVPTPADAVPDEGDGEAAPAWALEALAEQAPRRARGTAAFVGALGSGLVVTGAWLALFGGAGEQLPVRASMMASGVVGAAVGVAFLRVAARQWRASLP